MLIHLYFAFWRPDIRDKLAASGSPIVAMCDFIGNGESVVNDTRLVTCPACRETFLQALPTGDGTKRTWAEYLASPQALPRVTLAQRAAEADKADAAWSSTPAPTPGPQADVWATDPRPLVTPGGPATGSKADPIWSSGPVGSGWSTETKR